MGVKKSSSKTPQAPQNSLKGKKNSKPVNAKNQNSGSSGAEVRRSGSGAAKAAVQVKKSSVGKAASTPQVVNKVSAKSKKSAGKSLKQGKSSGLDAKKAAYLDSLSRGLGEQVGEAVCREVACEGLSTTGGYCRLHYIKNWKKIKRKEMILREKKLNQYIEELVAKYPDKYIEAIRQDLASDKDFAKVIYDLDLDESIDDFDVEGGESVDSFIDSIKRDFDDETDF